MHMIQGCKASARRWDPYKTEADGFDALFPKGTPMDLPGATDLYLMAMDAIYALEVRAHHGISTLACQKVCWSTCARIDALNLPIAAHGASVSGRSAG